MIRAVLFLLIPVHWEHLDVSFRNQLFQNFIVSLTDIKYQIKTYKNKQSLFLKKDQEKKEAELQIILKSCDLILLDEKFHDKKHFYELYKSM